MANKDEDFGQFLDMVTINGALALGIGLGSKLKIFDVMARIGPKTYSEIAEAGKWKPRLVR